MATATLVVDLVEITDCDLDTNGGTWSGITASEGSSDPSPIEGAGWIGGIIKQADDDNSMTFTPTTPIDMTGYHLRLLMQTVLKPLIKTKALGGIEITLYDGTNTGTWSVSGSDVYIGGWEILMIDPYSTPTSGSSMSGTINSILINFKIITAAKNIITTYFDWFSYGTGMYVYGGTSGDEIAFSHIDTQDIYYLLNQYQKGVYQLTGAIQLGDSTGINTTYFKDSGKVIIFQDLEVDSGLYGITVAGNATGTTVVDLSGNFITSVSDDWFIDFTDETNVDSVTIDGATIQKATPVELSSVVEGEGTVFDACGPIDPGGAILDKCTIKNTQALGTAQGSLMVNVDTEAHACDNLTFLNYTGATAYAIYVASGVTSFTMDNWVFDDPDNTTSYALYWAGAAGTLTISSTNGTNLVDAGCTSAGGTVSVVSSVDLTITVKDKDRDPIENVQTSIYLLDSPYTELMNEDTLATGIATESYGGSTPVDVMVRTRKSDEADNPRYISGSSIQTITSDGLALTVTMEVNPIL